MKTPASLLPLVVLSFSWAATSRGASILAPGDIARAFDSDLSASSSNSPSGEAPANILDGNSATKYLNFGGGGSGFIVTPSGGAATVQSFVLTTANDFEGRDPATWQFYGTNDPIQSANDSNGLGGENWTFIGSGNAGLPSARFTAGPATNVTNSTSFTSYKMVFPTTKTDSIMQIADVSLYTGGSATGLNVMTTASAILGIDQPGFSSSYPGGESPALAFDGNVNTKYLNFGKENAGLIIQPAGAPEVINFIELWTANDAEDRDPVNYAIYGSNDALASADNGFGDGENWTLINSGTLNLPSDRNASGGVQYFANSTAYSLYKFQVLSVKNTGTANSFQFSEIQLYGVPEPTGAAMTALGAAGLLLRRRRR